MCASISFDIGIRYVEGLIIGKKVVRKNVFVRVSVEERVYTLDNQISTSICEGGESSNPTWNEKFAMKMEASTKFILLEVLQKVKSKEKSVAIARVPTSDFVGNYLPRNHEHFLSYRLRNSDGELNGIINFSVNVKGNNMDSGKNENNYKGNEAYVPKPCNRTSYRDGRNSDDVVVGIPASWPNTCHG